MIPGVFDEQFVGFHAGANDASEIYIGQIVRFQGFGIVEWGAFAIFGDGQPQAFQQAPARPVVGDADGIDPVQLQPAEGEADDRAHRLGHVALASVFGTDPVAHRAGLGDPLRPPSGKREPRRHPLDPIL